VWCVLSYPVSIGNNYPPCTKCALQNSAIDTRFRPFEAAKAIRQLFRNPGDTHQVIIVLRALRGRSGLRSFRRFAASVTGAAVLRERRSLLAALQNRAALGQLPPGTVGHTYKEFMDGQNLSAEAGCRLRRNWGQEVLPPDAMLYRERMLAAHDLTHVLTGYGRDPLGEYCLLAFMYAQHTQSWHDGQSWQCGGRACHPQHSGAVVGSVAQWAQSTMATRAGF